MEMETNTLREDIRTSVGKVESLVFLILSIFSLLFTALCSKIRIRSYDTV